MAAITKVTSALTSKVRYRARVRVNGVSDSRTLSTEKAALGRLDRHSMRRQ
jgi:hypothetical protein